MPNNETPAYNLNKGYGSESNSQEKKDLMKDNPIARDASGSRPVGGSWMSKHSKSMGSPMRMGSPVKKHDGKKYEDAGFMDSHFPSGAPRQGSPATMVDDAALQRRDPSKKEVRLSKKLDKVKDKNTTAYFEDRGKGSDRRERKGERKELRVEQKLKREKKKQSPFTPDKTPKGDRKADRKERKELRSDQKDTKKRKKAYEKKKKSKSTVPTGRAPE